MTKTKSTKRALLMSGLALLLCVSMFVGSTFAWFTDSVTSAGNTIQSGTLKVDLVDKDGASMEGQVIEFIDKDNNLLWEPGCTYETEPVYVVNKGNLALKYQIVINGIDGNAKLLEAIEWTVTIDGVKTDLSTFVGNLIPGETEKSGAIVLSGHMKKDAGNEYQGLTAEGISITVFATQLTHEYDSFDNQYDAEAEYAAQTMLKNVAAVAAGESATVKLESDGYVALNETSAIGAKVAGDVTVDLNGKSLFVKAESADAHLSLFNIVKNGKLTVTGNGTIRMVSGENKSKVTAIFNNTAGTLVIENGTYTMDCPNDWQVALIPTIIDNNGNAASATTIINGGNFYHTRNMFRNFPSNNGITQLTINGGTFNGKAEDWAAIWNQKASSNTNEGQSLITVNGGEFNYIEIDNEFATGVTVADSVVMPVKVASTEELQAALDSAADGTKIHLVPGVSYGVVYMGRPTKNNDTTMTCDAHSYSTTDAEAFKAHLNDGAWHGTPKYTTTLKNLTVIGAQDATIAGLIATSGHATGKVYDYVRDVEKESGSSYYSTLIMENIVFSNVAFTGKVDINTSEVNSVYNGITFDTCSFTTGGTASANGAAIRYYNESNNGNVKNIVAKNSTFNNCYQGIYVHHVNGVTVTECEFDTTGHNAIALQSSTTAVDLKNVVITDNTFNKIGDRVIRFGEIGADSSITIQGNTATASGNKDGEVMRAVSIEAGITTAISNNNWNGGVIANTELQG